MGWVGVHGGKPRRTGKANYWTHQLGKNEWQIQLHTQGEGTHESKSIFLHVLLLFPGVSGLWAVLSICRSWQRMDRRAFLARCIRRVGRVRETRPRLAGIVVVLHQAEDPVCRHQLEFIRWVGYNKTGKRKEKKKTTRSNGWKFIQRGILGLLSPKQGVWGVGCSTVLPCWFLLPGGYREAY